MPRCSRLVKYGLYFVHGTSSASRARAPDTGVGTQSLRITSCQAATRGWRRASTFACGE